MQARRRLHEGIAKIYSEIGVAHKAVIAQVARERPEHRCGRVRRQKEIGESRADAQEIRLEGQV